MVSVPLHPFAKDLDTSSVIGGGDVKMNPSWTRTQGGPGIMWEVRFLISAERRLYRM